MDLILLGWPPRSPDIMVCDFFLWGYLEEHVYNIHGFKSYEDLKSDIEEQLLQIPEISFLKYFEHCCQCVVVVGF